MFIMANNKQYENKFWKSILEQKKILSDEEAIEMNKTIISLRKEK
jgi:hypothetical protein